jgi:hypothetical protein
LFTDGFSDQFRDTDARKFNYSNFKKLLIEICDESFEEQGKILTNKFLDWKGTKEQIDDVLVIGFKAL